MAAAAYEIDECIFEGVHSRIFRARRVADSRRVIIKQLRALYPTPESLAGLAREFEITRAAASPGVIEAIELITDERNVGIVLEDFDAESLASTVSGSRLPVEDVLTIALQVSDALSEVHRHDIVHKDISPSNIVWNYETGLTKLIDFGLSQVLRREAVTAGPDARFEGTPAYCSPEQTGRMNRVVDCRSDFYSLGATLYALLTGDPPFATDDPLALVHAHLAKTPVRPSDLDPAIPKPVSDIVMLLLEKRAEDRYQSATGLVHDLRRCSEELEATGRVQPFELRTEDVDERFQIPQTLYGRQEQVATLTRAFELAATGRARLLLVAGYSGIGKTSLVHEVHRSLIGRSARFVEGKFDQFNRGTPYGSLITALGDLVRIVLTDDSDAIDDFRARVLEAVGDNGRVLTEVIPEIEHVIGEQPEIDALLPSEARNRFQLVITNFVRAAASADHPLVLFLDDLQWADVASVELMAKLAGDPTTRHLLLIGAYRSNEVDATHPLSVAIDQMHASGAQLDSIELGPLGEDDVLELVSDSVGEAPGRVRLAVLCHTKTGGNPFFLRRFLEGLHEQGLITFDRDTRQWNWDLGVIQAQGITDNVIDYLSGEIEGLPTRPRRALEVASCIGDTFDLRILSFALDRTRKETLDDVRALLASELVQPSEQGFWFAEEVDESTTNFSYRFVHDRIRQAAHALLEEEDAEHVHLRLGRSLVGHLDDPSTDPGLFDVVEHLNRAFALIDSSEELDRLCDLNIAAGRRATGSAAFQPAHELFQQARACLDDRAWADDYTRTHAVHVEGARAAYLAGDLDAMATLVDAAIEHADSIIDRVEAQEVRVYALVAAQQLGDAVATALDVLSLLGVDLPREPTDEDVNAAVHATLQLLSERSADDIVSLPAATDPAVVAAQRIQNFVMSPAYLAVPRLLPLMAANIVQSTLEHGISSGSPYGFSVFALVLTAGSVIDVAYRTGTTAIRMLDRIDDRSVRPRVQHVFYNLVKPFTDPLRELVDDQQRNFQIAIDSGDLEYAAWALHSIVANGIYAGLPLDEMADTATRYLEVLEHHQQLPAIACTAPFAQLIRNLRGAADDPRILVGDGFDERAELDAHIGTDFRGAAFIITVCGTYARYLFGAHEDAVSFADAGGQYADGATATYHQVWWHQYRILALLAQATPGEPFDQSPITASLDQLLRWEHFSPANHRHRILLVDAELNRIHDRPGEAADLYDQAVAAAQAEGFVNEEALANELAGRFHLARGSETAGRAYLLEACYGYTRWGATAKTAHLMDEHSTLLRGVSRELGSISPSVKTATASVHQTATSADPSAELDLATLFKAAGLIASETRLDKLLSRVLDVAIENAGATRGYVMIDEGGTLMVGAARDADARDLETRGKALADCTDIPTSVVSFVERTGEAVVLTDARADGQWAGAPGVAMDRPTSILCAPIAHQDITSGIVLLENDLVAGAFTPARTQVLELLSRQAAISIENARYTEELRTHRDHLEELVHARTRELDEALSELKDANATLDKLSLTDALTGLPNRRSFDQTIDVEWARAQREADHVGVLMIDVDWFKRYNDHNGHQRGDDCLRRISAAIASTLHRPTDVVARYGGEEFAAILPGVDEHGAREVGEAMLEAVRALHVPHEASPDLDHVTISIGAASVVPDQPDPNALIKRADEALYRAKELGRNRLEPGGGD